MKENEFKKIHKISSCTQPIWQNFIPKDQRDSILRKIREETILAYGESFDECPKRKTCFTKNCLGRPLPVLSKTAKPFLDLLVKTHTIINNELFIANCDTCAIKNICTTTCSQVNDFMNRDKNPEIEFILKSTLEESDRQLTDLGDKPKVLDLELPWDILPNRKAIVIKKYLYEQKDFLAVANELDLTNQAEAKYQFYAALTKMAEYAVMRRFINENLTKLTDKQALILKKVYIENNILTDVAAHVNISTPAISRLITRLVIKFNIKWPLFVKKEHNKIIYNVPEILK